MKAIRHILALLAIAGGLASCDKNNPADLPAAATERTIVYAVDSSEGRKDLKSDAEWDAMLDHFCNSAQEGHSVTFYSVTPAPALSVKGTKKETVTYSTTSREEMKEWMKAREKEGRTVNVTYDSGSGTWNGTAYTSAPHPEVSNDCYTGTITLVSMPALENRTPSERVLALRLNADTTMLLSLGGTLLTVEEGELVLTDGMEMTICGALSSHSDLNGVAFFVLDMSNPAQGSVVGKWSLDCIIATDYDGGAGGNTVLYVPENATETLVYELVADGTATLSGAEETTQTGSWSISDDGMLCCDLLVPDGGCWDINWLTASTMILTSTRTAESGHSVAYQLELHSLAE